MGMIEALSPTTFFEWFKRFSEVVRTLQNPELVDKIQRLVATDRRMTLRMMEDELGVSRETIRQILVDDLGKRKICARFVPHCLTPEHKQTLPDLPFSQIINKNLTNCFS